MIDPDKDLPFGNLDQVSLDDDVTREESARKKAAQLEQKLQRMEDAKREAGLNVEAPATRMRTPKTAEKTTAIASSLRWLPWVSLVLLLGLAAWAYVHIDALQTALAQQQNQSSSQLDTLKSQISATGSSASETSDKLGQTLQDHSRELARLAGNDLAVRKQLKQLDDAVTKLNQAAKQLTELATEVEAVQKQIKLADIASGQLQMQQELNTSSLKKLVTQGDSHTSQLKALTSTPADVTALKKQMQSVQEDIRAFDKWRQQVNTQLNSTPRQ